MDADSITLQGILDSPYRYSMPPYQRYFTWEEDNLEELWRDLMDLTRQGSERRHFMGALVFVTVPHRPGTAPLMYVVDGQQRLVTLSLVLCAIRNAARNHSLGDLADEIDETYVIKPYQEGCGRYRLWPRHRDRAEYQAAVEGNRAPKGKIGVALRFFTEGIREDLLAPVRQSAAVMEGSNEVKEASSALEVGTGASDRVEERLRLLLGVIESALDFVSISLDDEKGAYQTFQSLDSTGVSLAQSDLIRCQVMAYVPSRKQDAFDDEEWRPIEKRFEGEGGRIDTKGLSRFLRHLLLMEGTYVYKDDTTRTFKERYISGMEDFDPWDLAATLRRYARLYDYLRGGLDHPSGPVAEAIHMLIDLDTTTAFPLALKLLDLLDRGQVTDQEVAEALRRLGGFVLRRKVCGLASTGYVRWFSFACKDQYIEHEDGLLAGLTGFLHQKGFPTDKQFKDAFVNYELFRSDFKRVALEALERSYPHRERADLGQAQVEHVMPQTLTGEWCSMLGPGAERLHERLLHTPGNLTLSAYNGELANHPFAQKRKEYTRSNILLTRHIATLGRWGKEEIEARSQALAQRAASIWVGPPFEESVEV